MPHYVVGNNNIIRHFFFVNACSSIIVLDSEYIWKGYQLKY